MCVVHVSARAHVILRYRCGICFPFVFAHFRSLLYLLVVHTGLAFHSGPSGADPKSTALLCDTLFDEKAPRREVITCERACVFRRRTIDRLRALHTSGKDESES
jgi:hypothetical protein